MKQPEHSRRTGDALPRWLERVVRLRLWWQWHARRAGGLCLGLRYHFPCSIVEDDETRWTQVSLSIGLICATLHLDLLVPRRELPLCEPKATASTTAAGDEQPNDRTERLEAK